MIKRSFIIGLVAIGITSCGGYSEEQGKAAEAFCECMDAEGDQDIIWYECDRAIVDEYGGEIMADAGWNSALEEKCPDVAKLIKEQE